MPVRLFTQARAALETTPGTLVTPMTRIVYFTDGPGSWNREIARNRPQDLVGSFFANRRSSSGQETNTLTMSGALSYNDAAWLGNLHLKGVTSGTGAGADKTYSFVPTSGTDDRKAASMEFGWTSDIGASRPAFQAAGFRGTELTLTFDKTAADGAVTFAHTLVTNKAATQISAFTGSLSDRTIQSASVANVQVYVDSTTIGSTADANVTSVAWTLSTPVALRWALDNTANAAEAARTQPLSWTATIRRYFNTATELNAYEAGTLRKLRVRALGPALGSSNYKIDLDLYGVYTGPRTVADVDGFIFEEYTLSNQYDTTAATDHSMTVVTSETSIS